MRHHQGAQHQRLADLWHRAVREPKQRLCALRRAQHRDHFRDRWHALVAAGVVVKVLAADFAEDHMTGMNAGAMQIDTKCLMQPPQRPARAGIGSGAWPGLYTRRRVDVQDDALPSGSHGANKGVA